MFTGLIECKGILTRIERLGGGMRLEVYAPEFGRDMTIGDSIAVDGVCLTVTKFIRGAFLADVSEETMQRTTLSGASQGSHVNLERALRLSDRLGGHIVTGHADAIGNLVNRRSAGNSSLYQFTVPADVMPYLATKGSVTVDGISLTVAQVTKDGFTAAVVPHTEENTTLSDKPIGAEVNIEADLLAKYVRRMLGRESDVETTDTQQPQKRSLSDMFSI